jgi:uncharacterized 2Fe-2S/4Fe-4S cluster protein (DUF4445 family)
MKNYTITFLQEQLSITVPEGTTLLDAEIQAGLQPDAPCGGQGTCGKCTVRIISGPLTGIQKACSIHIQGDMEVDTSLKATGHSLLTKGTSRHIVVAPMIQSVDVEVEKCRIGESGSDWDRLKEAVGAKTSISPAEIPPNLALAGKLYETLKACDYRLNVILCDREILDVRKENTPYYLTAFDIGTTSIVGYLLDGRSGEEIAVSSVLNPQSQYGADVIMRSNYALDGHLDQLSSAVRQAMNQILLALAKQASIDVRDIYQVSFVGNTCMHHLFLEISPGALVHSPYNPSLSEPLILPAGDYDIDIHPQGRLMVLPNIAGFVGADTVGCLLATDFSKREAMTLMIDIGTNGELVMGNKKRMITCSTAAGPAFEGAKITCGMRGANGAIDHLSFEGDKLICSTIGNEKPAGICGSGLMDTVSLLLQYGFLEESGRLYTPEELEHPVAKANAHRLTTIDNISAFILAFPDETAHQEPVFLSQKDIREVQLAKGAIAAGIQLLCQRLGISVDDIQEVLIAGAFGNYMSPESACNIGLIPPSLRSRITPIGNAAGEGSKIALINHSEFLHSKRLASGIEFLELAAESSFQDTFVDELEFPLPEEMR